MGHMAAMAQLCKFVAIHGLVKQETEEEKKIKREEAERIAKHNAKIDKERKEYLEFYTEKYKEISDDSAIVNFEYALENVHNKWINILYRDSWGKDIHSKIRYPDLHCKALMETHYRVLSQHARHLAFEAFHNRNCDNRIVIIGRVCNWWLLGEGWRG